MRIVRWEYDRWLSDAILVEDTRNTAKLLAIHGISRPLIAYNDHNAPRVRPRILERLENGERLALVSGSLPPQAARPVLAPISSIMGEILFFAITSDHHDPMTLRTIADTVVRRRLLALSGVSQVTPIGGDERQFQVIAHPDQLRANNISLYQFSVNVRFITSR